MRLTDCGLAIADCALDARPSNPQSAIRNPQLLAGALVLALLASPARAQQPDSVPTDTLAPVVVTGVRLPTVRELARGLTGRTATLNAGDLEDRKSTRLNSSHLVISYAVFCLKKKKDNKAHEYIQR